jgi:hypothetical protein
MACSRCLRDYYVAGGTERRNGDFIVNIWRDCGNLVGAPTNYPAATAGDTVCDPNPTHSGKPNDEFASFPWFAPHFDLAVQEPGEIPGNG